jgi:hypothetical protein
MAKSSKAAARVSDLLRVPSGPVDLSALDTRATPGFDGGWWPEGRLAAPPPPVRPPQRLTPGASGTGGRR